MAREGGVEEPDAAVELEITKRIADLAERERLADEELDGRVDALERWRAAEDAVSSARRWLFPILLSIVSAVIMVVNFVLFVFHK